MQNGGSPRVCQATFCAQAVFNTQRPISTISPVSSARGINCAGEIAPRLGGNFSGAIYSPGRRNRADRTDWPLGIKNRLRTKCRLANTRAAAVLHRGKIIGTSDSGGEAGKQ